MKLFLSMVTIIEVSFAFLLWIVFFNLLPDSLLWLSAFVPHIALCIVVLHLVSLSKRKVKFIWFALIYGPIIWLWVVSAPKPITQSSENTFTVLSLNVAQFGNDSARAETVIQELNRANADVICLQEFGLYHKWPDTESVGAYFAKKLSRPHYYFDPHVGNIFGVAIFSRFPIVQSELLFEESPATNQGVVFSLLREQDTIRVSNVQLASFEFTNDVHLLEHAAIKEDERRYQLSQLKAKSIGPRSVIVGDFNASPFHPELLSLCADMTRAGSVLSPTFPKLAIVIDHQFYSEDIGLESVELLRDFPSDHRAVLGHYSLL